MRLLLSPSMALRRARLAFGLALAWALAAPRADGATESPAPVLPPGAASASDAAAPDEATGFGVAPFAAVAYQDETSLLFGAAAVGFYHHPARAERRDSQVLLAGAVSLRKQFTGVLSPDLYLAHDRVHVGATLSAARFPDRFFGIEGRERLGDEEPYTPVYAEAEVSPKLRVLERHYVYVGPAVRYQYASIIERTNGGLLASGAIPGAEGGHTMQLGAKAFWDARDSTLYPTRGALVELSWLGAGTAIGSDYTFSRTKLDARQYVPSFFEGHVLALQQTAELRTGQAPFYDLGKLGGSRLLRGHFEGKHRDSQLVAVQAEYRFPVVWRFGATVFGGVGAVTPSFAALPRAIPYAAAGGGIRFAPSAKAPVNLRLDVAFGDEPRFYLDVGEAF